MRERVPQQEAILLGCTQVGQLGKEAEDRFVDAADQAPVERDPHRERHHALRNRLHVVQRVGVEGDVFHPLPVEDVGDLVGTLEVALEHQLAAACDQHGMDVGLARGGQPIAHLAQRSTVDELVVVDGGDAPAVVSQRRNGATSPSGRRARAARRNGASAAPRSETSWRRFIRSSCQASTERGNASPATERNAATGARQASSAKGGE